MHLLPSVIYKPDSECQEESKRVFWVKSSRHVVGIPAEARNQEGVVHKVN